jgi:hypothetical protein
MLETPPDERLDGFVSQPKVVRPSPAPKTTAGKLQFPFTSNPLGELVSHLTAKCGVEITANNVGACRYVHRNVADLGDKDLFFLSGDRPGQWICWDVKALVGGNRRRENNSDLNAK